MFAERYSILACWLMCCGLLLAGCQKPPPPPKPGPPTLKISYRDSPLPGQGKVIGVNNPSHTDSIKVTVIFVRSAADKDDRSYRLDRVVKPLDTLAIGWAELGGWKLKAGDKVRIHCEGYQEPFELEVASK